MRCRRLALSLTDQQAVDTLLLMAGEYDDKARRAQELIAPWFAAARRCATNGA